MPNNGPTNGEIADVLDRIADMLEIREANPHRVRAYRNGAESVRSAERRVADLTEEDEGAALQDLPGIGEGLAGVITEHVHTGRSSVLDRIQGEVAPEDLFSQVPGIGEELAQHIAGELNINTLVTQKSGPLAGRRVVRGREAECQRYYEQKDNA